MKIILTLLFAAIICSNSNSQTYQWAFSTAKAQRTKAITIKQDAQGNVYAAYYTGVSLTSSTGTLIEKRNANGGFLWSITIAGNAVINDFEFLNNSVIVVGQFKSTINIVGNSLSATSSYNGFIFNCVGANGNINWVKQLDAFNSFKAKDLFILNQNTFYLTSDIFNGNARCAFHKLDTLGNIVKTELPTKSDNATFSNIIADNDGNVFVTGTCGNLATFDAIPANANYSYQNFFVKYDSNFLAKVLITLNYSTFDDRNTLYSDNNDYYYWTSHDINKATNKDTIRLLKVHGPSLFVTQEKALPFSGQFSTIFAYHRSPNGNSVYAVGAFSKMYLYKFDNQNNIIWSDTLSNGLGGLDNFGSVACYDTCFYATGMFNQSTIDFNGIAANNVNVGGFYPSDIFICKVKTNDVLPIKNITLNCVYKNEKLLFNISTFQEENIYQHHIQVSENGKDFVSIQTLKANNNKQENNYEYLWQISNSFINKKIIYYRIKTTDNKGLESFSVIKSITINTNKFEITAINTTSKNQILLNIKSSFSTKANVNIYAINGVLIKQQNIQLNTGINTSIINTNNIAKGFYTLQFQTNTETITKTFIVP